jgi:uncharacterized protein
MSEAGVKAEPSMDEILASIRKIISEDDEKEPVATAVEEEPLVLDVEAVDEVEIVDEAEEEIELVEDIQGELEERGDGVDLHDEPEEVEAPSPPPSPLPLEAAEALVGDDTRQQAASSLTSLSAAIAEHRPGLTVEQLAEDLLRPMLREWLDANLPDMVERLVQKEIQRMADLAEPK